MAMNVGAKVGGAEGHWMSWKCATMGLQGS